MSSSYDIVDLLFLHHGLNPISLVLFFNSGVPKKSMDTMWNDVNILLLKAGESIQHRLTYIQALIL